MKALSMHLSQKDAEEIPYENGQPGPAGLPDFNEMASVDLNGTLQHEPADQPFFDHMTSMDLNESIRVETTDLPVSNHSSSVGAKMSSMGSGVSYHLSTDDLLKVQVSL